MAEYHPHHTFGPVADPDSPIVLVDLDGVVFDTDARIEEMFTAAHPHLPLVPFEDRRSMYSEDDHPEHYGPLLYEVVKTPGFYDGLPLVDGAVDGIYELQQIAEVFICTSPMLSNPTCMADKFSSVIRAFGKEWATRIVITKDKTLVRGDWLLDDRPGVEGKLDPAWELITFDRPYNRTLTGRRAAGWSEVVSMAYAEFVA